MAHVDYSIKDAEKLVKFDGTIKNVEVTRLTAPGENYVSLVLRVDFEVEKDGHSKIVSSVAKRLPFTAKDDGSDLHGLSVKNEIKWYLEIVPLFKDFTLEYGITVDFFPEYYGSRYSLDSSSKDVDKDAVLLLQNLIPEGYQNYDRILGSDLNTSKAIIRSMALFHAIPIGMKIKKPNLFQVMKEYLDNCHIVLPFPDNHKPRLEGKMPGQILLHALGNIPEISPYLPRVKTILEKPFAPLGISFKSTKEPWNTIVHNDFWVNNVMVNYKNNIEEPLVKIVDFQMGSYGSYAKDLVFFLFTSVRNDIIRDNMDNLLRLYYDEFTSVLHKTEVHLELTYEQFLDEVRNVVSDSEFVHSLIFSIFILQEKGSVKDTQVEDTDPTSMMENAFNNLNQYQKDRAVLLASESVKRNWI